MLNSIGWLLRCRKARREAACSRASAVAFLSSSVARFLTGSYWPSVRAGSNTGTTRQRIAPRGANRVAATEASIPAMQTLGKLSPRLEGAIVVLSHRDVTGATGEVDLHHVLFALEFLPGVTDAVHADPAVVAARLRMRGIVVEPDQRPIALGKCDRLQHGINVALGLRAKCGVLACTIADVDLAIFAKHAACGCNPLDLSLAEPQAIHRLHVLQRFLHG